ncbi:MAG TPA: YdcF family protein, partial [Leptolinea sp.]
APWICTSGGVGRLTYDLYHKPEAEAFAEVLINRGVPESAILIENQATNTAENIFFTRQILTKAHLHPESLIVLQKPYMGRRTFAALTQYWPEMKVIISSPPIAFEDYPFPGFSMEELINVLVGDFQRIHLYAERGWQAPQIIPRVVWDAYYLLISESYTKQLADPDSPPSIE